MLTALRPTQPLAWASGRYRSALDSLFRRADVLMGGRRSDLHIITVADFQFQLSVLQASSFKLQTSSPARSPDPKLQLQVRVTPPLREDVLPKFTPPTLPIFRATTPPERFSLTDNLSPGDKVSNPPRSLETVKERPPIQVGFCGVCAGRLGSRRVISVRMSASPPRGFVLIPVAFHPPKAEDETGRKKHRLRILFDSDVLKNLRLVELVSLVTQVCPLWLTTSSHNNLSPHRWYHPQDRLFRPLRLADRSISRIS